MQQNEQMQPIAVKLVESENLGIKPLNLTRLSIGMVIHGQKRVYINDECKVINSGELFIFSPGYHYVENVCETVFEQIVFYLSPQAMKRIMINITASNSIVDYNPHHRCNNCYRREFLTVRPSDILFDFFKSVNQYFKRNDFRENAVTQNIKLAELVFLILSGSNECIKTKVLELLDEPNTVFARQIYDNIFNDISIETLAKQTNRSLTAFKKEFRKQFHDSPHRWFMNRRLNHAKMLVEITNMTISEVGISCAFTNISHFIKLFKQRFHTTPAVLRKNIQNHS